MGREATRNRGMVSMVSMMSMTSIRTRIRTEVTCLSIMHPPVGPTSRVDSVALYLGTHDGQLIWH